MVCSLALTSVSTKSGKELSPLVHIHISVNGLLVVISHVPDCILRIIILNNWKHPYIGSLTHAINVSRMGRVKQSHRNFPCEVIIRKQYPGQTAEVCATLSVKEVGMVTPVPTSFNSSFWLVQKPNGCFRMTLNCWCHQLQLQIQMLCLYWSKSTQLLAPEI